MHGRGQIHHYQRDIGVGHSLITALDPQRLHQILAGTDAGRVHEFDWDSLDGRHFRYQVARGAGISVTMARSCSSSRLNRLLLPTLGRPTIASVIPA